MSAEDEKLLLDALDLESLDDRTREAFNEMLLKLESGERSTLSPKQREWAQSKFGIETYRNDFSAGRVPRGREVATPEVLKHRPLRPPGKR